ncbi:transposase [Rhizobium leguminosarum]|uniref:transposase n=1 Tax=Rhizobium leguminosarum TaxID=384 RepID=UPI001C9606E6|nr:transposase [Rhizobium leguminosarum]MBY5774869.1 transposase [Rhizobium leguminosarum]
MTIMTNYTLKQPPVRRIRRFWSAERKFSIVQETYNTDATVNDVARKYKIDPTQLSSWRALAVKDNLELLGQIQTILKKKPKSTYLQVLDNLKRNARHGNRPNPCDLRVKQLMKDNEMLPGPAQPMQSRLAA